MIKVANLVALAPLSILAMLDDSIRIGREIVVQDDLRTAYTAALERASAAADRARIALGEITRTAESAAGSDIVASGHRRPRALRAIGVRVLADADKADGTPSLSTEVLEALEALSDAGGILSRGAVAATVVPSTPTEAMSRRRFM